MGRGFIGDLHPKMGNKINVILLEMVDETSE